MWSGDRVLVTGGLGFIGSHLVDALMKRGCEVVILDNQSSGTVGNVSRWTGHPRFFMQTGDLLNPSVARDAVANCNVLFHLAASPEVRTGILNTRKDYQQNVQATYNLLEALKEGHCEKLVFTSTSTVYGEPSLIPTPETYGPLKPISLYGASKLACESLLSGYSHLLGLPATVVRLANIIGAPSSHGVIHDFFHKLQANPRELEILGDGTQNKSYLHVDDCTAALLTAAEDTADGFQVLNVGSEDRIDVLSIARIVVGELGLHDTLFRCNGGVDGGRGWKGDVKEMLLDSSRIKRLGWKPTLTSADAVRSATREIIVEHSLVQSVKT